ncbi:hypothetical protein BD410DRAFT_814563 [Rickenella mellea]|uniref:Alpha/beta-hydrolase n=1 Tax=Rickenella mellea TaxID=50990 RepID=A0A4Y7Q7K4_9AGAM|nr:hypothetical protein BD410DRAFT_814563 [Rickenella mellea]
MFEFRHQPLKTLYFIYTCFTILFIRVPYWTVKSRIVPRPRPSWGVGRQVVIHTIRAGTAALFKTSFPRPVSLEEASKSADKLGFEWVEPTPELIVGDIREFAKINSVEATRTGGFWYGRKGSEGKLGCKAEPGERVLYYLHGGGHIVIASAHPSDIAVPSLAGALLQHCPTISRIFALEYRLSSAEPFEPSGAFPAAIIDIVAGYTVLLISPTVDWAITHTGPESSMVRNKDTDYCGNFFEGYTVRALLGKMPPGDIGTNAYMSPGSLRIANTDGMFKGFPPTCIVVGEGEIAYDSNVTFRDRMMADLGRDKVTWIESYGATHDFVNLPWFEPERTNALKEIGAWMNTI